MPGYKKGQSIRLLSCNTGTLNHGFAQDLANKLNVTVWAQAHICGLILTGNTSLLIKNCQRGSKTRLLQNGEVH